MVRMKKENILARKLKFSPVDNSGAVWAFYQRIIYTKATLPFKLKSEPIADHVKSGFFLAVGCNNGQDRPFPFMKNQSSIA